MDQYLFLYPLKLYFDAAMEFYPSFSWKDRKPSKLNEIINERYRNRGFDINWLFFSQEGNVSAPDMSGISEHIQVKQCDRILNSGISFERFQRERVYPDPGYILGQLPKHNSLALGGFHKVDCVEQIASLSYQKGINTFVDEDTTELFFPIESLYQIKLAGGYESGNPHEDPWIEFRKDVPWLNKL